MNEPQISAEEPSDGISMPVEALLWSWQVSFSSELGTKLKDNSLTSKKNWLILAWMVPFSEREGPDENLGFNLMERSHPFLPWSSCHSQTNFSSNRSWSWRKSVLIALPSPLSHGENRAFLWKIMNLISQIHCFAIRIEGTLAKSWCGIDWAQQQFGVSDESICRKSFGKKFNPQRLMFCYLLLW